MDMENIESSTTSDGAKQGPRGRPPIAGALAKVMFGFSRGDRSATVTLLAMSAAAFPKPH